MIWFTPKLADSLNIISHEYVAKDYKYSQREACLEVQLLVECSGQDGPVAFVP